MSYDKVLEDSHQALYPTEFLNTLNISGVPPHKLRLKKSLPIMLLRNINPTNGMCNGSRFYIRNVYSRIIEAEIALGIHIIHYIK